MSHLRLKCTACETTLQISAATTAKKIKCSRCGAIVPLARPVSVDEAPQDHASTDATFAVIDDAILSVQEEPPAVIPVRADTEPDDTEDESSERKEAGKTVGNPFRLLLLVLLAGYFPFLAALTLGLIGIGIGLIIWGIDGVAGPDGFAKV